MEINDKTISKIAHLARLHLEDQEIHQHKDKLNSILNWVEQLKSVDTDNIEPLYHPLDDSIQPVRDDVITEKNNREELLTLSETHKSGLYLVPKVID